MSVITPKSCWLHVPKTGGVWVEKVLLNCVKGAQVSWPRHAGLSCCPKGRFVFAFVRHPYTWYQSYWSYKQKAGWDPLNAFDQRCKDDRFDRFMDKTFDTDPAHYTKVIYCVMGNGDNIDFVGHFENLQQDLEKALKLSGDILERDDIGTIEAINQSKAKHKAAARYASRQKETVAALDHEVFERFGYSKEGKLL